MTYPRDYLAWCFDGADTLLNEATKEKHYSLMEDHAAQHEARCNAYYAAVIAAQPRYWPDEYEPVPRYQRDTDHIISLLKGATS